MSPSLLDKQQFHNETGGHLGVVVLSPKGEEVGVSVPPDGFVYLSEAEQRLTAAAPRNPKDNPFVEQEFETIDPQSGERKTIRFVPLVPSADERFVPGVERPIPSDLAESRGAALAAHAATTGDTVTVADELTAKSEQVMADDPPATASPRAAAAAAAAQSAESPPIPEETAQAPQGPQEEESTADKPSGPLGGVEVGRSRVNTDEFTHGAGEETGAAAEPQGDAATGSFSPGEEVGTPDSSSAVAADAPAEPGTPPPYTPEG